MRAFNGPPRVVVSFQRLLVPRLPSVGPFSSPPLSGVLFHRGSFSFLFALPPGLFHTLYSVSSLSPTKKFLAAFFAPEPRFPSYVIGKDVAPSRDGSPLSLLEFLLSLKGARDLNLPFFFFL